MAVKKSGALKLRLDAPVSLVFSLACIIVFACDFFIFKGKIIPLLFTSAGNAKANLPFNFSNPLDYIKIFTHVFGESSPSSLLINLSFILLLGPVLEERYGSPLVALEIAVVALVSGVLNACCVPLSLNGSSSVVFSMLLLACVASLNKKELPVSFVLVFVLYLVYVMYAAVKNNPSLSANAFAAFFKANLQTFTNLAASVCGMLFGFLVAPKKPRVNKRDIHKEETVSYTESAVKRPSAKSSDNGDSTFVGEIKL